MRLNAPKQFLFILSVCLIVVGLIASLGVIPFLPKFDNWISFAGGALLAAGCLFKGM